MGLYFLISLDLSSTFFIRITRLAYQHVQQTRLDILHEALPAMDGWEAFTLHDLRPS